MPSTRCCHLTHWLISTQAGGTAAAILVGDHKVGHPSVGSGSDMGSAFLGEMVGTCLVVLVVLGTATVESTRDNMYFALAIGFAILGAGAAVGGASGGCFNPAVGLLVFVSDSNLADAWIYWVAPPIGALFGLMAFRNFGTDLAPIFKPSTLLLYIAAQVAGALAVRSCVEIKFRAPHAIDAMWSP